MRLNSIGNRPDLVVATAIGAGLVFRLRVALMPIETLTSRYLADDYFYYLNIARNIAEGHGSSFDGGVTFTNGYQPLFVAMLTVAFKLGASKGAAVHLGLLIQAVAAASASILAWKIARAWDRPAAGALAAGLISLNLFFVLPTLTGFEMALSLAAVLLAAWAWERQRPAFIIGILCGFAVLARIDSALLAFAIGIVMIRERRMRDLGLLVAGFSLVAGPWILWNWMNFGHPLPDSGVIKAHYRGLDGITMGLRTAFAALPRVVVPGSLVDRVMPLSAWMMATVGSGMLALVLWAALRNGSRALVLYSLGLTTAYLMLIDPIESGALVRYLFPVWAVIAMLLVRNLPYRWATVAAAMVLILHVIDVAKYLRWESTAPLPDSYVGASYAMAAPVIDAVVPQDERVGAFDAGALGYFASRTVINLDGLVNHDIVELRRSCKSMYADCLLAYMRSKGITTLVGGTGFSWARYFPEWQEWEQLYESAPLVNGSRLVLLRMPQ